MTPDKWPGYNSDEDRRRPDIDALRDVFWGRQQESPTYYTDEHLQHLEDMKAIWAYTEQRLQEGLARHEQRELQRTPYAPVKPFDSAAEADEFHADIARFLKGEAA